MARKLEEQLAAVSRLRDEPDPARIEAELRRALASRRSALVARAAKLVGELELTQLGDCLGEAFSRFLGERVRNDDGCLAKTAIAEAAYLIGADCAELFLTGIKHVQMEPVWGGRIDTAAELRGHCAMGLVRLGYAEVLVTLAQLLADQEVVARQAAARAIGFAGQSAGVPLLVLKLLSGDSDSQVIGECCSSLLELAADLGLELAARFLQRDEPELVEAVALAVGESRLDEALPVLQQALQRARFTDTRSSLLLAVALLRRDEAIIYLLSLVAEAPASTAAAALTALALYRHDECLVTQIRDRVQARTETVVTQSFEETFGS